MKRMTSSLFRVTPTAGCLSRRLCQMKSARERPQIVPPARGLIATKGERVKVEGLVDDLLHEAESIK